MTDNPDISVTDIGKPSPPLEVKWHYKRKHWVITGSNGYLYPSIFRAMAWLHQEDAQGFLRGLQTAKRVP